MRTYDVNVNLKEPTSQGMANLNFTLRRTSQPIINEYKSSQVAFNAACQAHTVTTKCK